MSKVISFSISDRYLDKLRTLYPALTDNLAAKQFLTDRLNSSLGNSLDDGLDDGLDGKLKSLIESELDGILEGRLDATVGKSLTSLSERLARLEARLDGSLDGSLDEMELLLRMQREASISSPLPTGEPSPIPTIEETVESVDKVETVTGDSDSIGEPVEPAIGPVPSETDSIDTGKGEGMNPNQSRNYLKKKGVKDISYYYLNKWAKDGVIDTSPQGRDALKHLILINKLYYPID